MELIDVLKGFKDLPKTGIIAFINNQRKEVFVAYYTNIMYVLNKIDDISQYDEVQVLEKDIDVIYARNFFLKYYYRLFYKQGFTLIKPNKYIPNYRCVIRYRPKQGNYAILLTTVMNEGKKLEMLGILDDPLEAFWFMETFKENNNMPFCVWNNPTRKIVTMAETLHLPKNYSPDVLMGIS